MLSRASQQALRECGSQCDSGRSRSESVTDWMSGNERKATGNDAPDIFWGETAIVVKMCRSGSANWVVVGAGRGPAMHVRSPAS